MRRTLIDAATCGIPDIYHPYIRGAQLYDSSCSPEARVIYIEKDGGYYLKSAPSGTLAQEAAMNTFFHDRGMGPAVIDHRTEKGRDWMLTARVSGEDCTHDRYLSDPKRLCGLLADILGTLHGKSIADCPRDRMADYDRCVREGYETGRFDISYLRDFAPIARACGYEEIAARAEAITDAEEAFACYSEAALDSEVLLHGDYCLPNIMLDDWSFSGFIDLGGGGAGDRHIDLYWALWTLWFNLKTVEYSASFLDAYGRWRVDPARLLAVAAAECFG